MQQADLLELFGPILERGAQRRRLTDYAAVALLVIVLAAWGLSLWRNRQVPRIESIQLVPGSVAVIGPAERLRPNHGLEFCPGDEMTVRYQLDIDGEGTIYADDVAHRGDQTATFSLLWRDIVNPGTRIYENTWKIPPRPDMPVDGQRRWLPGIYTRVISVAASNVYVSRYVPPATFDVPFRIAEGC